MVNATPLPPCLIIAEAGVNHQGNLNTARALVQQAKSAGADIVKFQWYQTARLVVGTHPDLEMLRGLEFGATEMAELKKEAEKEELLFLCSVFDEDSLASYLDLGTTWVKVPSGELTNLPLLRAVAQSGKSTFLSTGMSDLGEVESAVRIFEDAENDQLCLLHCASLYPANPAEANLRAIQTLYSAFGYPVGWSDHTLGWTVAVGAVVLGASVVEKHLTLSRRMAGPDHHASLEPEQFRQMVEGIRAVEAALGDGKKRPVLREQAMKDRARKSLVANTDIKAGTVITREMVDMKRPGTGLSPSLL